MLICILPLAAFATCQEKGTTGDFARSSTEHIINYIDQPFIAKSVAGVISRTQGDQGAMPGVLFELQGTGTDRRIRRTTTDQHGRFKIRNVPEGTYKFKATLDGFQSVMGTISIAKKAPRANVIKISMSVGV